MDTDLALTFGLLLWVLSVPASLAAWVDGRVPRIGLAMLTGGAGLVLFAVAARPGGYRPGEVPTVMLEVLARLVN